MWFRRISQVVSSYFRLQVSIYRRSYSCRREIKFSRLPRPSLQLLHCSSRLLLDLPPHSYLHSLKTFWTCCSIFGAPEESHDVVSQSILIVCTIQYGRWDTIAVRQPHPDLGWVTLTNGITCLLAIWCNWVAYIISATQCRLWGHNRMKKETVALQTMSSWWRKVTFLTRLVSSISYFQFLLESNSRLVDSMVCSLDALVASRSLCENPNIFAW